MPITNYSVLAGDPVSGKVVDGSSMHYQITTQGVGGPFTVAVNIESVDGSEVLYAIKQGFTPPDPNGLLALPLGMHPLDSVAGGLALDYVRGRIGGAPMITRAEMSLLPKASATTGLSEEERVSHRRRVNALQDAVVDLLNQTIADKDGVIYAFGSAYADSGRVDGIHDIHMNQGNPLNNHGDDNGVWQDGGLFLHLPAKGTWTAVFIAFQTESWVTDGSGDPA